MIIINLDVMMAKRKMSLNELSDKVGITLANLSILKNNHAKAVRLSTLDALCRALDCQPADILEYVPETSAEVNEQQQEALQVQPTAVKGGA
ncbi:MAG: helix-turn-helix transcriptional regulator [Clostridia bacterium]|nr:helix-turn-helix transcriptional regulator [Clostridia bacterium]